MDIHKPKPWHGLREFLKEYAIIVVGKVLTALAAEQAVEWLHTRTEVAEAREALRHELGANVGHLSFAEVEDRCFLKSMDLCVSNGRRAVRGRRRSSTMCISRAASTRASGKSPARAPSHTCR